MTTNQTVNFEAQVELEEVMSPADLWEQELDMMGHNAPIESLRAHLATAPMDAPSRETLATFVAGYDKALQQAA